MILAFEIIFSPQQRIIEIENPQVQTLAEVAGLLKPGWNWRFSKECTFWFYSREEDGLLNGHIPISRLPLADDDEVILLPVPA